MLNEIFPKKRSFSLSSSIRPPLMNLFLDLLSSSITTSNVRIIPFVLGPSLVRPRSLYPTSVSPSWTTLQPDVFVSPAESSTILPHDRSASLFVGMMDVREEGSINPFWTMFTVTGSKSRVRLSVLDVSQDGRGQERVRKSIQLLSDVEMSGLEDWLGLGYDDDDDDDDDGKGKGKVGKMGSIENIELMNPTKIKTDTKTETFTFIPGQGVYELCMMNDILTDPTIFESFQCLLQVKKSRCPDPSISPRVDGTATATATHPLFNPSTCQTTLTNHLLFIGLDRWYQMVELLCFVRDEPLQVVGKCLNRFGSSHVSG
ncbi:hypothetical protein TREMEDRAFT_66486 [Tremella mesenterica DSM 1558]|nr:uncharacterized protein TREMEDRAFT_66486 [Tremella mesenterica DSM 1558]EIW65495.1 hypothetical protein TREMEDRAFT_66486 [Tremella mesenterica DSM 1558]